MITLPGPVENRRFGPLPVQTLHVFDNGGGALAHLFGDALPCEEAHHRGLESFLVLDLVGEHRA